MAIDDLKTAVTDNTAAIGELKTSVDAAVEKLGTSNEAEVAATAVTLATNNSALRAEVARLNAAVASVSTPQ